MKWIGQHIFDLVARFRSDVHLDDIQTGTIASGGNLGLDSNNKIVKATEATGDITGVRFTADDSNIAAVGSGSADFTVAGGTGIETSVSSTTVTFRAVPGQIDHDSLQNFVAAEHYRWDTDISSTATINAANIPTLNQNTTGNAATATNLVASTSTAVQLGTVELGNASDTTLSRSAAGTLAVEGKNVRTEDKHLFIKQGSFALDPGTARIYFPMTGTAENTSPVGVAQPFLAPVNGKLLKIHLRSNKDHSGFNQTFHLVNWDSDEQFTTGNLSDIGAKTVTGVDNNNVITIDFQSGLDSGTNEFTAGELIAISVTNASDLSGNTKYIFTAVFEFDFSSY